MKKCMVEKFMELVKVLGSDEAEIKMEEEVIWSDGNLLVFKDKSALDRKNDKVISVKDMCKILDHLHMKCRNHMKKNPSYMLEYADNNDLM